MILNVLTNAVQSITNNGSILFTTDVKNDVLLIHISDTGCGISKENVKKVTDPFFTTKPPGDGTGLGMSISYSIIQRHKGRIKYLSEPGKGTTVCIKFPVKTSAN